MCIHRTRGSIGLYDACASERPCKAPRPSTKPRARRRRKAGSRSAALLAGSRANSAGWLHKAVDCRLHGCFHKLGVCFMGVRIALPFWSRILFLQGAWPWSWPVRDLRRHESFMVPVGLARLLRGFCLPHWGPIARLEAVYLKCRCKPFTSPLSGGCSQSSESTETQVQGCGCSCKEL